MLKTMGLILAALFSLCGAGFSSPLWAKATIRVVGDHAPPFRIFSRGQAHGIYFDVVSELARRLGAEIIFEEQPFKRALFSLETGTADMICGPNYDIQREEYLIYLKTTLPRENKAFYVSPESPPITRFEDLREKKIATLRGAVYFDRFDNDPTLIKNPADSYEQAINKVCFHRDDVVIIPETLGDYLLKDTGVQLRKSGYIVEGRTSYLAISRKSNLRELRARIDQILAQIVQDGTMNRIQARYR